MARPILLSNGQLHVGLNIYGLVHDFYYPHVGLENHTSAKGLRHRVGIRVEDSFHWLDDGTWRISYEYHAARLISKVTAIHDRMAVRVEFDDFVDSEYNAFIRNIHVTNTGESTREIRLFLHQVFVISDSHGSDTAQYLPDLPGIIHYKGHRSFIIGAKHSQGEPFDQYSVGLFGIEGREGTFRDAEDGQLSSNPVEHGRVDSTLGFIMTVESQSTHKVHYWIAAGKSKREALRVDRVIREQGVTHRLLKTSDYWKTWIKPTLTVAKKLPEEYRDGFVGSALLIKAQTDKNGAVLASADTTMLNYERDSYAYCWTRDGAFAFWPLLRIGYTDELVNFFSFCRRIISDEGYLGHKYQADGALGPSWHPYVHPGAADAPPIQTDETAIVLFMVGQYYRKHNDSEFLKNFYPSFIAAMANFLAGYVDEDGLPRASYDLWEQKFLTTTYTASVTYASLLEASYLADQIGLDDDAVRWRTAAEAIYDKREVFYNHETNYFHKGYVRDVSGQINYDSTVDSSSLYGAFMFGLYSITEHEITSSYKTLTEQLYSDENSIVRYRDDDYHHSGADIANPWPVTSLWFSQYALEVGDTKRALDIIDWVKDRMGPTYAIAEQYTPHTYEPRSVNPLTWSQAEYMSALLDLITEDVAS